MNRRVHRSPLARRRQGGVAIITALLLTALAITIVASLFWQQQVQVRSMENQRLHLQTKWILRGALDWARLILREDGRLGGKVTALDGIWATPVAETRLDDYVERERLEGENYNATLSGQMSDAQARYNLSNLAVSKVPVKAQVEAFQRLLTNLQIDPGLAQAVAQAVANSQPGGAVDAGVNPAGTSSGSTGTSTSSTSSTSSSGSTSSSSSGGQDGAEPMPFMQVEDLLSVAGFTPQHVQRLRDYLIVLPGKTKLNVNTGTAEVISAVMNVTMSEAAVLVAGRKTKHFGNLAEATALLAGKAFATDLGENVDVLSGYFLVQSRIRLDRAALDAEALMQRLNSNPYKTTLMWIREN